MATYFKRNVNTNWNQNTSWSTVSSASATNAGTFPKAGDTATFDAGSASCTVNVASACTILDMTGYAGIILMTSSLTMTGNTCTLGGSFDGAGEFIFAGTTTINPNGVSLGYVTLGSSSTRTLTSTFSCFSLKVGLGISTTLTGADIQTNTLTIYNKGELTIEAGRTLTLTNFYIDGLEGFTTSLVSDTASSPIYVNFTGNEDDSVIALATLTDVEFTSTRKMKNWWGTNTRVTNCDVTTLADRTTSNLTLNSIL